MFTAMEKPSIYGKPSGKEESDQTKVQNAFDIAFRVKLK
jgi:hypothetical protein